jgi:pyridoxine kinase
MLPLATNAWWDRTGMQDGILSIQSAVAYGHVGNSAAVFPLQRLGFEAWPVNTVLFSNHTGYGVWRGQPVSLDCVNDVIAGVEERGAFAACAAVVSGYLGTPDLGEAVLGAVRRVRQSRPDALYACDPVMGDEDRGFFVKPGIPEFFRAQAVPAADILTPNAFELAHLAGHEVRSVEQALAAATQVRKAGPRVVVCTSLLVADRPGELAVVADTAEGSWIAWTPLLDIKLSGTGDVFTALYLANFLRTRSASEALERATSAMYALAAMTAEAKSRELVLVAAQDQIVAPRRSFPVQRLR